MSDTQTDKPALRWTAGEWAAASDSRGRYLIKSGDRAIAQTYEPDQGLARLRGAVSPEADARLITSAPDLAIALLMGLDALEEWMCLADDEGERERDSDRAAVNAMRAALRKAGAL